ncbi:hypothetical protein IM817_11760 [Serratia marcescens]|uniref:hypothetical protein n=1 Tax=Serratia marcescens TaxID=615 RepID=UPI001C579B6B|nr:hypothetical protein [Serratia marcescens]QXX98800.1 hypothetical protein IM817_11760 [Serratia marcescens]
MSAIVWDGISSPPVGWVGIHKINEDNSGTWVSVTVTYSSHFVVVVYNTDDAMKVEYAVPGDHVETMSDIFKALEIQSDE